MIIQIFVLKLVFLHEWLRNNWIKRMISVASIDAFKDK